MSTDRELLDLAAKAAGIRITWHGEQNPWCYAEVLPGIKWNPLTNDGDALRLAIKLELLVSIETCYYTQVCKENISATEHIGNEGRGCIYAATRRAIVRVAAEIGKQE